MIVKNDRTFMLRGTRGRERSVGWEEMNPLVGGGGFRGFVSSM